MNNGTKVLNVVQRALEELGVTAFVLVCSGGDTGSTQCGTWNMNDLNSMMNIYGMMQSQSAVLEHDIGYKRTKDLNQIEKGGNK